MTNLENNPEIIQQVVKRGRGRPKGAKNKPKVPKPEHSENPSEQSEGFSLPRRRGRPKGSKNKPKETSVVLNTPSLPAEVEAKIIYETQASRPETFVECTLESHPVVTAAKWLERKMPIVEIQYYKTRAGKQGVSVTNAIAMAILGLFNVQDQEIRKQVKI
jgi:hypothetical protein